MKSVTVAYVLFVMLSCLTIAYSYVLRELAKNLTNTNDNVAAMKMVKSENDDRNARNANLTGSLSIRQGPCKVLVNMITCRLIVGDNEFRTLTFLRNDRFFNVIHINGKLLARKKGNMKREESQNKAIRFQIAKTVDNKAKLNHCFRMTGEDLKDTVIEMGCFHLTFKRNALLKNIKRMDKDNIIIETYDAIDDSEGKGRSDSSRYGGDDVERNVRSDHGYYGSDDVETKGKSDSKKIL
ncbi:uncharacterized protein LOC115218617 [Octopus sinensis]|uniref:Uncharacterized protein LOC115218617 n=1 Tax=Octopus sinensis TaxID=2607531 RepID=A0A7E6FAW8_9MOLL|nr:uncharacterized protein LOC115218617 [Octopus sinensis]